MNRREFLRAFVAVTAAAAVPAVAAQKLLSTAPLWKRTLTARINLSGAPWMIHYTVGDFVGSGTAWEFVTLTHDKPDAKAFAFLDKTALLAFQRAGVL